MSTMLKSILVQLWSKLYLNLIGAWYVLKEQVWDRHRRLPNLESERGKTIVITGGNRGIGIEAVKTFLRLDCTVVIGCRDVEHARAQLEAVPNKALARVLPLDLMNFASVRTFAAEVLATTPTINVLVNNAGIMFGSRRETAEGYESQLMTNYLGHWLLGHLLLPGLRRAGSAVGPDAAPARLVNVSSCAHFMGSWLDWDDIHAKKIYSAEQAYGNSKAAQVMFSKYLDAHLQSRNIPVRVVSVHPGVVHTDLYTHVGWVQVFGLLARLMMKTPEQGGDTVVYAAMAPELSSQRYGGVYLENSHPARNSSFTSSPENQARLWQLTASMLDVHEYGGQ